MLRVVVLVAGMTTMATEMSASRLLAPFFGTSVMVWANVIGLILMYLAVGYWYGGRLADRHPTEGALANVSLAAAAGIAVIPFITNPVLMTATGALDRMSLGAMVGSFVACMILFSGPVILLGMIPPFAIRLAVTSIDTTGGVAGSLYALSTIGSIVGTFLSVLLLIPWIGTRRTMLVFAFVLALLAAALLWRQRKGLRSAVTIVSCIMFLTVISPGAARQVRGTRVLFGKDSRYQFVQVVQRPDGRRELQLNEGWAVHSVYVPNNGLTGGEWDHMMLGPLYARTKGRTGDARMLLIGNAAGTTARLLDRFEPGISVDGVEIDPMVTSVGYRFFDMPRRNLTVHTGDGREWLDHAHGRWDVIGIDAYRQPYIPFHLVTREFFHLVRSHLNSGGALVLNVGTVPEDQRIEQAIIATLQTQFPSVFEYQAATYNTFIIATRDPAAAGSLRSQLRSSSLASGDLTSDLIRMVADRLHDADARSAAVLTDDHAPVEWMTDRMIVESASRGRQP